MSALFSKKGREVTFSETPSYTVKQIIDLYDFQNEKEDFQNEKEDFQNEKEFKKDDNMSYITTNAFCKISDLLAEFLNKPNGTIMSRQEISRQFYCYIKNNKLWNNLNPGVIMVDNKLSKLFKINNLDNLNYENFNNFLLLHITEIGIKNQNVINQINLKREEEWNTLNTSDKKLNNNSLNEDTEDSDNENSEYSIVPEPPTVPIDNINLCFVGGVSTGKSTILNAIFCEELTQCKIKRTTMVPTIYIENENDAPNITSPELIFTTISDKNKEIIEKTETGKKLNQKEYDELKFNVGKLDINILNGSYVNVYDIPGLNDARTKDVYYDYLDENFTKFNLVVLLVDIHSGLNTSDEIDIVNFITNHTKYELETNKKEIYTLVVVNKADDMQVDEEDPESILKLTGELSEMFDQVQNTITSEFKNKKIQKHLIGIIPLCAIDSYLYRMVKKHGKKFKLSPEQILKIGINENGKRFSTLKPATQEKRVYEILDNDKFINDMIKLSGFSRLENILHKFLTENGVGKEIRINNILFELGKYPKIKDFVLRNKQNIHEIEKHVKKCMAILKVLKTIDIEEYDKFVTDFLCDFNLALSDIIRNIKHSNNQKLQLIEYYDDIHRKILTPYFSEFITEEYPDYMKDHMIDLIYNDFDDKPIQIETIIENFNILKRMNLFNAHHIDTTFATIISNRLEKKAIYIKECIEIDNLIDLLKECDPIATSISNFIRFVLINLYSTYEDKDLYRAQMLFHKHGEIPMYTYLTNTLDKSKIDILLYVYALNAYEELEKYKLELYYISYEKKNNIINFENNIFNLINKK
jgi:GTP-binding protein EngB required for normal cell division